MTECCKDCAYRHELKYGFARGFSYEWRYRGICTMLIETDGGKDAFAMYVKDDDRCEAFTARSDNE